MVLPTSPADVIALARSLPDQQCSSDPWLTWLLKENIDLVEPFLCHRLNWLLERGAVLSAFKSDYVAASVESRRGYGRRYIVSADLEFVGNFFSREDGLGAACEVSEGQLSATRPSVYKLGTPDWYGAACTPTFDQKRLTDKRLHYIHSYVSECVKLKKNFFCDSFEHGCINRNPLFF